MISLLFSKSSQGKVFRSYTGALVRPLDYHVELLRNERVMDPSTDLSDCTLANKAVEIYYSLVQTS